MQKMGLFAVGVACAVWACGPAVPNVPTVGISSAKEAAQATKKVNDSVSTMQAKMARQLLSGSSEYTGTCPTSGSSKIKTSVDLLAAASGSATVSVEVTADKCYKENAFRVSGQLKWGYAAKQTATGIGAEFSLDGTVAFESFKADGSVEQSGVIDYNALKVTLSVETTGTTSSYKATVSGSFTVGGTTYTPTEEEWGGSFFGGF